MHEMALVEGVLRVAEDECARHPGHHVVKIELEIGLLRQVVEETFRFLFEHLATGTMLEGAELVMDLRPVRVRCSCCQRSGAIEEAAWMACPFCGGFDVEMLEGDQFLVRSLQVEPELDHS